MTILTLLDILPVSANDSPAIIVPGNPSVTVSRRELRQQVEEVQERLAQLGLALGSTVAICLPNSLAFAAAFLATTWQRSAAAPLNPAYTQDEIEFYIDDLGASAVFVPRDAYRKEVAAVRAARKYGAAIVECYSSEGKLVFDVKETGKLASHGAKSLEKPREEEIALVLHTSGTTGRPKAVSLSHRNLSVSVGNIIKTYQLAIADRTMLIMPLFHVHGLLASFLATLGAGSAVIIPNRLAPSFWTDFTTHLATWYTGTPTLHKVLLSFSRPAQMPQVRFIRSCSSPLPPQVFEALEARFDAPVLEAYAMTEASHQITSNPLPEAPHFPGSVGLPQGDIEVKILDSQNESVGSGNEGEICIRGPSIMAGYISNPAANKSAFTADGFFRTGDYGKMDGNGYLFLTGRIKEFINKGGEKISPVELDNILAGHTDIADVVFFAIDDEMYGQDIGAAVQLKDGVSLGARDLQKWMRQRVAPHKIPKKIWFPKDIPKTATGKVQRKMVAEAMIKNVD